MGKIELSWQEINNMKIEDVLNDNEIKIYNKALNFFNEIVSNSTTKQKKEFAKSMLDISSMKFAKRYADPHKSPNLYKKIYQILRNYNYFKI